MAAARLDLPVTRGDDEVYQITWRYKSTGLGINLSSYTSLTATVKSRLNGSSVCTMTVGTGSAASGIITLTLAKADAATFTGDEVYDLQWTTPASLRKTALVGRMLLEQDVT